MIGYLTMKVDIKMAELNFRKRGTKWEYRFEGAKVDGKRKQISKGGFKTKFVTIWIFGSITIVK